MKRAKKLIAAGAIALGIGAGAVIVTPIGMNASGNVVLASVDWVTSQLNPLNTKITGLQTKTADLEAKIAKQQQEIESLKAQIGNQTPTSPPPPPEGQLPSVVYAKSSVDIRSGASTKYKILASKPAGSSLKVIGSVTVATGLWYRIEVTPSILGWVFSGDVSTTKPAVTAPTTVTVKSEANIRRGASTVYTIVATVKAGTNLKYLSTFTNSNGETWYNVETSAGVRGWMISTLGEVK
ncbi:SH3 domain-containing protein [Neobacillus sp. YIM B06451]|uniref:SH3 domain-containing protein n=1 Tax=Neobacillus sp. YIM B06451 TaxID=3070994 RepID=UPI00292D2BC1|nr:SH3 domain-containing protein [Neobacillus sp. YIM B06451]